MTERARVPPGTIPICLLAVLVLGAAVLPAPRAWAGSCCGGGGGAALVLPKALRAMVDLSADLETYHGFWNQDGKHTQDPPGSDLRQYRLNLAVAGRLSPSWQTGITLPYVWNVNSYSGISSRTDGFGDTTLAVWYEAVDERSVWKMSSASDMIPAVTIGPSLLVPTGKSPYDDVHNSFDVTGRGFYRIDGNLLVDKTVHPITANVSLAYGTYIERPVNREYGRYVEPYRKKLGNRSSASGSLGYILFVGSRGDKLTGTATILFVEEADATVAGRRDTTSGFRKTAVGGQIAWSSTDHDWSARAAWSHAVRRDDWGENFPTTDIYTIGVRYGFR